VHVVTSSPQLAVTEIVQLDVERLHPDNLTGGVGNTNLTQFLAQNLNTRAAKRQGVVALVLSAVYLPSQLDVMHALAGNQLVPIGYAVYLSTSAMHVVFHNIQDEQQPSTEDIASAIGAALGPLQPLSEARLQEARMAERSLRQQLRLWDAASWNAVLQQHLLTRPGRRAAPWLAIRSLMAPPALQAAKQLVEKTVQPYRLRWLELPESEMRALTGNSGSTSTSASTSGSRIRPGRRISTTEQGVAAEGAGGVGSHGEQQGSSGGVVVVISTCDLTFEEAAELPAAAFTDVRFLEPGSISGGSSSSSSVVQEDSGDDDDSPPRWPMIFGR
jgi:hypothetical protein